MSLNRFAVAALAISFAAPAGAAFAQYGPPAQPPGYGYGQGGWEAPPSEMREVQRQGFRDGIDGARKDFGNHRRPDVKNRDEFRHPNVPHNLRRDYREGFRRGYQVGAEHLYHDGRR